MNEARKARNQRYINKIEHQIEAVKEQEQLKRRNQEFRRSMLDSAKRSRE